MSVPTPTGVADDSDDSVGSAVGSSLEVEVGVRVISTNVGGAVEGALCVLVVGFIQGMLAQSRYASEGTYQRRRRG